LFRFTKWLSVSSQELQHWKTWFDDIGVKNEIHFRGSSDGTVTEAALFREGGELPVESEREEVF
jgi:hypothetical protein